MARTAQSKEKFMKAKMVCPFKVLCCIVILLSLVKFCSGISDFAFDYRIEPFPTRRYEEILLFISNFTAKSTHQREVDERRKIYSVSYRKLCCEPSQIFRMGDKDTVADTAFHNAEIQAMDINVTRTMRQRAFVQEYNAGKSSDTITQTLQYYYNKEFRNYGVIKRHKGCNVSPTYLYREEEANRSYKGNIVTYFGKNGPGGHMQMSHDVVEHKHCRFGCKNRFNGTIAIIFKVLENRKWFEMKSIDENKLEETGRRLTKENQRKMKRFNRRLVWRYKDKIKFGLRWGKREKTIHKNSNNCPKCMGIVLVIGIAILSVIAVNKSELINLSDEMGQRPIKKIRRQLKTGNERLDMKYRDDTRIAILSVIVVNKSELINLSDEMGQRPIKKIRMQLKRGNERLNMKYRNDAKYKVKTVSKKSVSLHWNKRDNRMLSKEKQWLYMKEALGWTLIQKQRK